MADETLEKARIEEGLAETRARMDRRLDELQDHLTPRQLINDAFVHFRGGDGADFTRDLVAQVRANPLPAALIGVGVAWLMAASRRRPDAAPAGAGLRARLASAELAVVRAHDESEEAYEGRLIDARARTLGLTRNASETAAGYAQRIREAIASIAEPLGQAAGELRDAGSEALATARQAIADHIPSAGEDTMNRSPAQHIASLTKNPLALGAVAAVVGIVAGSLIPTSEQEEQALGSAAGRLRAAGKDLAQDVVDRGGRVANEALAAVRESAGSHGLTTDKPIGEAVADLKSGELVENVKQVAHEALSAGQDSVGKHFGGAEEKA